MTINDFSLEEFLACGAIISLPDQRLLVGWGTIRESEKQADDYPFYFNDFLLKKLKPWMGFTYTRIFLLDELLNRMAASSFVPTNIWKMQSADKFNEAFYQIKELMARGLKKAVPFAYTQSSSPMTQEKLSFYIRRGLSALKTRKCHLYGYWNSQKGLLGMTPEQLFEYHSSAPLIVQTMALAGTCQSKQMQAKLMQNHKEQKEHQLVIEGIKDSLSTLGEIKIEKTEVLELTTLKHIKTAIKIKLFNEFNFDSLVSCLHPTPALGAFPKEKGSEWLNSFHCNQPAGYFGGPIGLKHSGHQICLVGIRNFQWNETGMRIYAGCGIIDSSVLESEWNEVLLKIEAIKEIFLL
jgi:isochorismate synthase EntC